MNDLTIALVLIIWFLLTVLLAFSIVGLSILVSEYNKPSSWMTIGRSLTIKLIHGDDTKTR